MKEENINQESTNIETNPNTNEINTYSNDILIEDEIKEKEYMSKIEKEPLSLFEFMTEEKFKQWEEKLFNLNPRIKRLIPSEKSNQEIFMNLSQQKIKEKDIINNDSIRTRSRESILLPDFKKLLEQSLQLFCFLSKSNYKQGLNEIFGPLILLKYKFNNLPIYKIINLASALVDKFFPNYFYEKGVFSLKSALALYQILLKYHEPKIYNLLELADKVYKHDNDNNIYKLLIDSLKKIDEGYDYQVITNIFELKMLEFLGIKPVIDECVNCGSKHDIVTISSYRGGYLCKNCLHGEVITNIKTVNYLRMFYYVDISKISKLEISDNIKKELSNFINDYYDRYSGLYLKSREFLQNLEKIK